MFIYEKIETQNTRAGNEPSAKFFARAFSWLKAPTNYFTFKTLLRHYAKQALNKP